MGGIFKKKTFVSKEDIDDFYSSKVLYEFENIFELTKNTKLLKRRKILISYDGICSLKKNNVAQGLDPVSEYWKEYSIVFFKRSIVELIKTNSKYSETEFPALKISNTVNKYIIIDLRNQPAIIECLIKLFGKEAYPFLTEFLEDKGYEYKKEIKEEHDLYVI